MSALHHRGSWIVYFNGVEVPAISASVSFGVWGIPQANIAVPADKIMQRIGADDRVRCTIFALDTYRSRNTREADQFRLVFDGEILNYGYQAQSQGRSMNFTAIDFIESLTRIFPFFVTSLNEVARNVSSVDTNTVTPTLNPFAPNNSLFNSGVTGETRIERPFDFVKNVLDFLLGDVLNDNERSVITQQWYGPWNNRTKFSSRFVPSPFIEDAFLTEGQGPTAPGGVFPIFKAAQAATAVKALANIGEQIPNGSFYRIIQSIFQHVYYELAFIPTAPFLKVNSAGRDITGSGDDAADVNEEKVIASYMTKPQTLFSIPPACNVLWPSMITGFSYEENYATQPTRTYLGNPHIFNFLTGTGPQASDAIAERALTVGYPPLANQRLSTKNSSSDNRTNIHNFLTPEEYFKGPVYNQLDTPTWYEFLTKESGSKDTEGRETYNANLQRLYARYEHFRTRASRRNGGVTMHYNPYVLPGFPGVVIDNETSANHVFGYFTNVTHSFSQQGMSTNVNFTHSQTLSQYLDTMIDNLLEDGERTVDFDTFVRGAPRQPIYTIRDRTQTLKGMREFYARAFYGQIGDDADPRVVFDFLDVFGLANDDGSIGRLDLNADLLAHIPSSDPNDEEKKLKLVSDRRTGEPPDFKIRSTYRQLLTDPGAAYSYASRPITTLDQWIEAQGEFGVREGVRNPLNVTEGKGAKYYVRILNFNEGPADAPPQVNTDGNPCVTINADTLRSWQNRLLKFRRRVYQSLNDFRA